MALIIPPGYLQAVYVMKLENDPENMVITMGHEIDSASGANLDDAPNDLFNAFNTHIWQNFQQNVYTLVEVVCYVGNDGPPLIRISDEEPAQGPGTGQCLPPNTAYLIRKRTDLGGRRGRGRFYFPGALEGHVDNVGNVSTEVQGFWATELPNWYDALTSAVGARYYPPVVLHRSEGIGPEPEPTPITSFTFDPKVATQRRRLRP